MTDPSFPPPPPRPPRVVAADNRGSRAAWLIFGLFAWAELTISVVFRGDERLVGLLAADVGMVVLGPVIGLVVHFFVLPPESRKSFWLTGVVCSGIMVLLWGLACSVAFAGS
jgi:hypothetical protein